MTTTTINKAELLSAALSAVAEDRDVKAHGLNAAAVAAYIPEIVEAADMPDEIPVTMTGREIDAALLNGADDWKHYAKGGCAAICGTYEILARHHGEKEAAADDVCEALEPAVRALRVEDSNDSGCYNVPTYALPYLINADPSGLSDEEIAAIDEWYAGLEVEGLSFTLDVVDSQAAPYFSNCPAFGLPAECERVAVTYFPDL